MIKCIAIDDEPLALRKLVTYIKKIPYLELVGEFRSAAEAKQVVEQQEVEAIFLDINMPDLNGIDFAKSVEQDHSRGPIMVFTTAYAEYAIEGYKANAVGYLLKPYGFDEFEAAAQKVRDIHEIRQQAATEVTTDGTDNDVIFVKSDYKIVRIDTNAIRYIEAMSEYLRIIHRSYIINLNKLREVKKNHVVLDDNSTMPIGDNYKDAFMAYLNSKFLTK